MLNLQKEKSALKEENRLLVRKEDDFKSEVKNLKLDFKKELQTVKWLNDDMELQIENLKLDVS